LIPIYSWFVVSDDGDEIYIGEWRTYRTLVDIGLVENQEGGCALSMIGYAVVRMGVKIDMGYEVIDRSCICQDVGLPPGVEYLMETYGVPESLPIWCIDPVVERNRGEGWSIAAAALNELVLWHGSLGSCPFCPQYGKYGREEWNYDVDSYFSVPEQYLS